MPSSVIRHFSYNSPTQTLVITFVAGLVYHYQKVPEEVYKMLRDASSKDRYFNYYIKNKFTFKKVEN